MAVRDYESGVDKISEFICRDTNVIGPDNVYAGNWGQGQGCCIVWFNSVPACRAMLRSLNRVPTGRDAGLCEKCRCHYSITNPNYKLYEDHACKKFKQSMTKQADDILRTHPDLGKKTLRKKVA